MPDRQPVPLARGARTILEPLAPEDEQRFLARAAESVALHAGWVNVPRDSKSFQAYLAREDSSFRLLLARRSDDDELVGVFNLSQIAMGVFCSAYLGYYGFRVTTRQGYMQEAMSLLLHHAFLALGLHRVEANVRPENVDSVRLVRRCGFEREGYSPHYLFLEGEWRDHERWAIRREIWTASDHVEMPTLAGTR